MGSMQLKAVWACTNNGAEHDEEPMRTLGTDKAPKFNPKMVMRVPGV
jgi:hypothetical protein